MKKFIVLMIVVVFVLGAAFAFAEGQKPSTKKFNPNPDTLVYAAMSQERAPIVAKRMEPLLNYIAEVTGKKVEIYLTTSYAAQIEAMLGGFAHIYLTTSYAAQIEAMLGGFAHIANFGPFAYVMATEKDPDIEVFATYEVEPMPQYFVPGGPKYVGILVTKKGTQYTSIDVAFPDPGSTSGWLVPNVLFTKEVLGGKSLDDYFGQLVFTGSHDSAILAVLNNKVAAAFTWDSAPYRLWQRGEMQEPNKALNLLWSSSDIPLDPYSYRKSLNADLKEKIKRAFLTWHEQPQSAEFFKEIGGIKFVEMKDSDYDVIRDLYEAKKKMKTE